MSRRCSAVDGLPHQEAANAFAEAIRILGSTPGREASRGEALIWADNGLINEEARAAFTRAVALDPGHVRSRFYLARALQQDGDTEAAAAASVSPSCCSARAR